MEWVISAARFEEDAGTDDKDKMLCPREGAGGLLTGAAAGLPGVWIHDWRMDGGLMNSREDQGRRLPFGRLSLLLAVSFLCAFSCWSRVYADQNLPTLSDRAFNNALSEMVVEYERDDITPEAAETNPYLAERLIVRSMDPAFDPEDYGAVDGIRSRRGMTILQFDSVRDTRQAEKMLQKEDSTVYVVPDRYVFLQNDVYTMEEAHVQATREQILEKAAEIPKLIGTDVLGAELSGVSGSVKVAVLDTGISFQHEYLAGRLDRANAFSFIDGCNADVSQDSPYDCLSPAAGHGTHVAGIIAKCTEQTASQVQIMPVRVLDNAGSGSISTVIVGIWYAVDHGAKVINMSFGGETDGDPAMKDAVRYAVSKGVTVVAAAGNEGSSTMNYEPSSITECVVVGAVDRSNDRAVFSNYGQTLDLVAPGVSIVSSSYYYVLRSGNLYRVVYASMDGTSMAAPHAAGAAALIRLKFPGADAQQVEQLLQQSTRDLGTPGWDSNYGYGLLDLSFLVGARNNQVSEAFAYISARKAATNKAAPVKTASDKATAETAAGKVADDKAAKEKAAKEKAAKEKAAKEKAAAEKAAKKAAERKKAAAYTALYRKQKPHANADYMIPLQRGKSTKALKVIGLLGQDRIVSWKSSDPSVVSVKGSADGTCNVTAGMKTGKAVVSAVTDSRIKVSFRIRVQKKKVKLKGIKVSKKKIELRSGQSVNLLAFQNPITAGKTLKYSSSKKSVASVSSSGTVTAKKPGSTVITVKCGKKKIKVKVKVRRP